MQRLEVSGAVGLIYTSLGVKRLRMDGAYVCSPYVISSLGKGHEAWAAICIVMENEIFYCYCTLQSQDVPC